MLKIFNSPFRVTQTFANKLIVNGKDYYAQFGLAGHEGLDLVPTTTDRAIFSMPYPGVVVLDIDMASKGGAYGIHCTIWYPSQRKAFMYCHLAENKVVLGEQLSPSTWIGVMGGTGNTNGDHLHLNQFEVDGGGIRLNRNNGFLGGVDPLPFINGRPPGVTPSTGGTVNMSSTVLVSDVIKASWEGTGNGKLSDFDLATELTKVPFNLQDLLRRLINAAKYHTDAEFNTRLKEEYDQGVIDGKAQIFNSNPQGASHPLAAQPSPRTTPGEADVPLAPSRDTGTNNRLPWWKKFLTWITGS